MSEFEQASPKGFLLTKDHGGEERLVTGVVLEPNTVDSQGDIYTAGDVRKAMYSFMEEFQNVGLQHAELVNYGAKVVECWVTRSAETIGDQTVKPGTWLITMRVESDQLWKDIREGRLTGFSIGGYAKRVPLR